MLKGMIRIAVILLSILLFGCSKRSVVIVETVVATSGVDRLILKNWETVSPLNPAERSRDSHSLVWQRNSGSAWTDYILITQKDFQSGRSHSRCIVSVHDFDPASGTAIIKVAEGDAPESATFVSYIYSWREWDLKGHRELKTIHVCADPFEPFPVLPPVDNAIPDK